MLNIQSGQLGQDVRVLRPVGELDAFTVMVFRAAIAEITGPEQLVIDLSRVPFVDSAGLGALIGGIRRTRELGGQVALASPRPSLMRLFHSTGIDRIAPIAQSTEEAADVLLQETVCTTASDTA